MYNISMEALDTHHFLVSYFFICTFSKIHEFVNFTFYMLLGLGNIKTEKTKINKEEEIMS